MSVGALIKDQVIRLQRADGGPEWHFIANGKVHLGLSFVNEEAARFAMERALEREKKGVVAGIPNTNEIKSYFHCGMCVKDWRDGKAPGESPGSYARLNVGFTELGIQVWCTRHECNVVHIDFEGARHPANTTRVGDTDG